MRSGSSGRRDHCRGRDAWQPFGWRIAERFHKTLLDEFYRVAFRKKLYRRIEELQADLDAWLADYNEQRPHHGRWCYGKTPMQTFIDTTAIGTEQECAAPQYSCQVLRVELTKTEH
jgi:hypothetical protein